MRMWDEQLERMERYYRCCEEIRSRGTTPDRREDDCDTVYSFFIHCYHLKDWLKRDCIYAHRGKSCSNHRCAECHVQADEALKLCGEFCNGIKHLNRLSEQKGRDKTPALPGRGVNYVDDTAWLYVIWADGTCSDPFEAISAARNAWKAFIIEKGGVASADLYEELYGSGHEN